MRRSIAVVTLGVCLVSGTVSAQVGVTIVNSPDPNTVVEATINFGDVSSYEPPGSPFGTLIFFDDVALNASNPVPFGFTAYTAGEYTATITLAYFGVSHSPFSPHGYIKVNLVGNAESGFDPVVAVNDLIVFTGEALMSGSLAAVTYGKRSRRGWRWRGWFRRMQERMAANRVKHFLRWLMKAETLIQAGEFNSAYYVLSALLRRVDGNPSPRDYFVANATTAEIAARIESLRAGLDR